jgi:hypothetical protein
MTLPGGTLPSFRILHPNEARGISNYIPFGTHISANGVK